MPSGHLDISAADLSAVRDQDERILLCSARQVACCVGTIAASHGSSIIFYQKMPCMGWQPLLILGYRKLVYLPAVPSIQLDLAACSIPALQACVAASAC